MIRAFAREDFQENRFEKMQSMQIIRTLVQIDWFDGNHFCANHYRHDCSYHLVCFGSSQEQGLQMGDLVAFIEYSFHALLSFLFLSNLFTMCPRTAVSSERLRKSWICLFPLIQNEDGVTETETHGYFGI